MKPAKISRFLLPRPWRYVGIFLLGLMVAAYAVFILTAQSPEGWENFIQTLGRNNLPIFISLIQYHLPVIGLILLFISREEVEDELSTQLRLQSLVIGLLVTLAFSVVGFLIAFPWKPTHTFTTELSLPFLMTVTVITYWVLKRRGDRNEE